MQTTYFFFLHFIQNLICRTHLDARVMPYRAVGGELKDLCSIWERRWYIFYVLPHHVENCNVMKIFHVLSHHVENCNVMNIFHVLPHHVENCNVMNIFHVLPHHVENFNVMNIFHVLPHHVENSNAVNIHTAASIHFTPVTLRHWGCEV